MLFDFQERLAIPGGFAGQPINGLIKYGNRPDKTGTGVASIDDESMGKELLATEYGRLIAVDSVELKRRD